MFKSSVATEPTASCPDASGSLPGPARILRWTGDLARLHHGALDAATAETEAINCIRALEELKSAAAAAQARLATCVDTAARCRQAAEGIPKEDQGKGVAAQIALARRESPSRGSRHLGFAKALVHEMPHTHHALTTGRISEWRATLLVRETACLALEDRATVDREVAADAAALERLSDRALIAAARKTSYRLDPHSIVRRAAKAATERNVTCRPAPDTMAYLTALLPAAHAVSVLASLTRAANSPQTNGDTRTRGQIMADTLVKRTTRGSTEATDVGSAGVSTGAGASSLEIQLVMTDRTLLAGGPEPAELPGYGTIPAQTARDLARRASKDGQAWIRRLYTTPEVGQLVGMDSRARLFPKALAQFIATRDQLCSTPWCDAPIRHTDHILPHAANGTTTEHNGRGLCEACNYAKEAPGWNVRPDPPEPGGRHSTTTTAPTGHTYRSRAPALPGAR